MILVSRTYWGGMPFWFRGRPEDAAVESLVLSTHDLRQVRGLYWTSAKRPAPKVGVVVMHPRVDFTHHYAIPHLLAAGFGVLAANTRFVGNEMFAEHEPMLLDVAACIRHLRDKRGVEKVVLFGNCGGASLASYYQAEASLPPARRLAKGPGGAPTHFDTATMPPADVVVYVAAHRGQGKVLQGCIDPSIVDESDVLSVDPELDMYDARNGFREPPEWSSYDRAFLERYQAAQAARVARIDERARAILARHEEATRESEAGDFDRKTPEDRRDVLRRRASEPVLVVYRTMANPAFVDRGIDASPRDYGSLLSERPDLMNYAALGLARTCTARAWLSTWSGLSSKASMVDNVKRIETPTLVVHAERDREVFPSDFGAIADAVAATDKTVATIAGARHYFEPEPGERESPHVGALMDVVVPWIEERVA